MPCTEWLKSITNGIMSDQYGRDLEKYINSKNPKTLADIEKYTLEYERKIAEQAFKF